MAEEIPSRFEAAIVRLDLAMREKGHLFTYGSDYEETTIYVLNRRDEPDVPPRWEGYPVGQRRHGRS
jgi:hypothetical protein